MAQDKILPGYEQSIGAKLQAIVDHFGPISYSQTTGDIYPASNLGRGGFDKVSGGLTLDGLYNVVAGYPAGTGAGSPSTSAVLTWNFATSGAVASVTGTGGTGMTVGTYALAFSGGGGSGAVGTLTVLTGTTFSTVITSPGKGYTSAPTVTAATGGTPPTLTANLSTSGSQAPTGSNLSGSAVRLEAIMY